MVSVMCLFCDARPHRAPFSPCPMHGSEVAEQSITKPRSAEPMSGYYPGAMEESKRKKNNKEKRSKKENKKRKVLLLTNNSNNSKVEN